MTRGGPLLRTERIIGGARRGLTRGGSGEPPTACADRPPRLGSSASVSRIGRTTPPGSSGGNDRDHRSMYHRFLGLRPRARFDLLANMTSIITDIDNIATSDNLSWRVPDRGSAAIGWTGGVEATSVRAIHYTPSIVKSRPHLTGTVRIDRVGRPAGVLICTDLYCRRATAPIRTVPTRPTARIARGEVDRSRSRSWTGDGGSRSDVRPDGDRTAVSANGLNSVIHHD